MSAYTVVLSIHVIVALLGLGPLMALALLTRRPPLPATAPRPMPPEAALRACLRLLRLSQVSLGLMLGTGATLIAFTHGAFGHQRWMMVSGVLFVLLGGGAGATQHYFKKALTPSGSIIHVEWAHRFLLAMCVVVAAITWLMQAKPF
jgi:hypothetical protein